jgi:hypothetical protein
MDHADALHRWLDTNQSFQGVRLGIGNVHFASTSVFLKPTVKSHHV